MRLEAKIVCSQCYVVDITCRVFNRIYFKTYEKALCESFDLLAEFTVLSQVSRCILSNEDPREIASSGKKGKVRLLKCLQAGQHIIIRII